MEPTPNPSLKSKCNARCGVDIECWALTLVGVSMFGYN